MFIALSSLVLILANSSYALNNDKDQVTEIFADSATHNNLTGQSVYSGNVVIQQGSILLEAQEVALNRELASINAKGSPAHFQQTIEQDKSPVKASANNIVYMQKNGQIELLGNANIHHGDARISGERIVYNVNSQTLDATNSSASPTEKPSRVHVILPPQNSLDEAKP
jgi:lipopolysaccharide export system protein LptA